MSKILKIIILTLIVFISNFVLLINTVQAVEGQQIKIYTKGEFKRIIKFNQIVVKTAHAVYEKNGKEYPVYCLNKDLHGVGEYIATYDVVNQGEIIDLELWRVITNGYPYKSIEQLGVEDEGEAYTATKQAIYCHIYNRGTENYEGIGESGNRVIKAINLILENAKKSSATFENQNIKVIQSKEWQIEENCIVKQYEIKSDLNIAKYIVDFENQPKGSKIINSKNEEKKEFNSNEKFKISIPITSLEKSGEFKIKIQTEMETKPIFYGKAPSADLQDYALTAFAYEDIDTELIQSYEKNKTKIIIEKQDSETKKSLKGAKFEILNSNKKVIKIIETDEKGQIILEQILPGTYYIREIKSPEGYELNNELREIEIKLNEQKNLKILNNKIIVEEPQIEEIPKIEELLVEEVAKLPITGM